MPPGVFYGFYTQPADIQLRIIQFMSSRQAYFITRSGYFRYLAPRVRDSLRAKARRYSGEVTHSYFDTWSNSVRQRRHRFLGFPRNRRYF